jgi:hypothetical protein
MPEQRPDSLKNGCYPCFRAGHGKAAGDCRKEKQMGLREEIVDEINHAEQRLAELKSEIESQNARIAALRNNLDSLPPEQITLQPLTVSKPQMTVPVSSAEKVALFRSLFRGREDVFPRRWENLRNKRSGYSPACKNEWEYDLCEKKKGRSSLKHRTTCGECQNQAFIPVSDEEITKHLMGQQVMGVYPLLKDETCWFLAIDFDKKAWQEDVAVFVETCGIHDVPVAIERSRSGNGAHAWFFFTAPVEAVSARKMGCFLITETMARRHQISMESYDRLFPNQDTLPKGGFGNLIALPLQHEARSHGNSVFVDVSFVPCLDQWAFLANVRHIDPILIQQIADEASRKGQVIGVRMSDFSDEDDLAPWNRPPSGRLRRMTITDPLPSTIHIVLSQRLFIEKTGLPSPLLNQIKRLAAFQNPEFYKKQGMRLTTTLTPRVINCAEELSGHIVLPRGCLLEVASLLQEYGISPDIEDKREQGLPIDLKFHGTLTPMQQQAAQALIAYDTGVFLAPPGVGKTVVGIHQITLRGRNTLILVHRKPLLDQWIAHLALFLGIDQKTIGQVGAGKRKPNGRLDVAMLQSLVRKRQVDNIVAGYGHVIVDECHHVPAVSFERVMSEVKARFVLGLTATLQRRDGHHPIIQMQIGPVRFNVGPKSRDAQHPFEHRLIVRETDFPWKESVFEPSIQEIYSALATDEQRNTMIFNDVVQALEEHRSPILLTERRDHLEYFASRLKNFAKNLVVLHGGMKPKERRQVLAKLSSHFRFHGKGLWFNMPVASAVCTPEKERSGFTITWIEMSRWFLKCFRNVCAAIGQSVTIVMNCCLISFHSTINRIRNDLHMNDSNEQKGSVQRF